MWSRLPAATMRARGLTVGKRWYRVGRTYTPGGSSKFRRRRVTRSRYSRGKRQTLLPLLLAMKHTPRSPISQRKIEKAQQNDNTIAYARHITFSLVRLPHYDERAVKLLPREYHEKSREFCPSTTSSSCRDVAAMRQHNPATSASSYATRTHHSHNIEAGNACIPSSLKR